jgi:eukaryotic-like serine/threonine-protein kinase
VSDTLERLRTALADRYRLERELGAGGMATVYLAHDLRHDRRVAVKVLRPELAAVIGADRFLAEIRTTANLQHPHILPLLDSGGSVPDPEVAGHRGAEPLYYVMPYIEGESLRQRLGRERQLPVADAVRIATEVAGALDYAHRQGVIHRDIKPENILLHDDRALVADFGIALAASKAGGTRMTETGMSLGTPQYMSPEQAMGEREIDARSDVYALGCVLYEMLAGEPPFTGPTAQAIVAKLVSSEPVRVTTHRRTAPANVESAVQCALAKVPADRFRTAADFAAALANPEFRTASEAAPGGRVRTARSPVTAALGVTSLVLLAAVGWQWTHRPTLPPDARAARLSITLPDSTPAAFIGAAVLGNGRRAIAVSPDGGTLVYAGLQGGIARLYVRPIDSYEVRALPGTEGAFGPFFSPNGRWIGFFVGNELKKTRLDGGEPVRLAEATNPVGADWGTDHRIVFATQEGLRLLRVSDEGGPAELLLEDPIGYGCEWPRLLPGGEAVMLSSGAPVILNLKTRHQVALPITGTDVRYAAGYLIFVQGSALFAAGFDLGRQRVTSPAVPVLSGIRSEVYGQGQWDMAEDGTLVYAPGQSVAANAMVWIGRDGSRQPLSLPVRVRGSFELSPDGRRLAVIERSGSSSDLWVYQLPGLRAERLTVGGSIESPMFWSRDGARIAYHSAEGEYSVPYLQSPEGGAAAERLLPKGDSLRLQSWSADGQLLGADDNGHSASRQAVYVIDRRTGARRAIPTTGGAPWGTAVSPDGRAIAYTSDETGEYHIYLQPYPPTGARRQVSRIGGSEEPRWTQDGARLFFRNGQRIMEVPVATRPELEVGEPRVFFEGDFVNVGGRSYDIDRAGQRVLVIEGGVSDIRSLRLIQGWIGEVGRLVQEGENSSRGP